MSAANVSVVTVTYHTGPVLLRMLEAVLAQEGLAECLLVDNGNPPEVLAQLKALAARDARLRLFSGHGNIGFAAGSNLGARRAVGDYLLILNPDCIPAPGFLAALAAEAASHPRPNLVSCRLLDGAGHEQSGSRRALLTPDNALAEVFQLYRLFPDNPKYARLKWHEQPLPDAPVPVPCVSGAVMLLAREDFWSINGFDEGYFLHVEDIDFCLRFTRAGGTLWFMPQLSVTHLGGTSQVAKARVEFLKTRSFVRYFNKNFKGEYSGIMLALVSAAAWARYGLRAIASSLGGIVNTGKKSRGL